MNYLRTTAVPGTPKQPDGDICLQRYKDGRLDLLYLTSIAQDFVNVVGSFSRAIE